MARIYFAGSISGGRKHLHTYIRVVEWLRRHGHDVLTEHVALPEILSLEKRLAAEEIYERDVQLLESCDAVIAEVTSPSLGVGYEVCYALERGKPVLCMYKAGTFVSRMITGNTSADIKVRSYGSEDDLFQTIAAFLNEPVGS